MDSLQKEVFSHIDNVKIALQNLEQYAYSKLSESEKKEADKKTEDSNSHKDSLFSNPEEIMDGDGMRERNVIAARESTTSSEASHWRPELYPHSPAIRADSLEQAVDSLGANKYELLDNLKLQQFEGFYNLAFILLLFSLFQQTVRGILEDGLHVNMRHMTCSSVEGGPVVVAMLLGTLISLALLLFVLVKLFVSKFISKFFLLCCYVVIQLLMLILPVYIRYSRAMSPLLAGNIMLFATTLILKCHSYVATINTLWREYQLRQQTKDTDDDPAFKKKKHHLHHINLRNFLYFLAIPTVVYEPSYPRTDRIRVGYLVKKSFQAVMCAAFMYFTMTEFVLIQLKKQHLYESLESIIMLMIHIAIPTFLAWLAAFYMMFSCVFNIVAELLMYGDRQFYRDWWNCTTIDGFWRKWNSPIHEFCLRHIYIDGQHYYKLPKTVATLIVFFVSAVFHEIIFSVSFGTFTPLFFLGMMCQIPLVFISQHFRNKRRGNLIVWLSLFGSFPLLGVVYIREYYQHNDSFYCV